MIYLCVACGTSYETDRQAPAHCAICDDERQYVPPTGQRWTTFEELMASHANTWRQHRPGLLSIRTVPDFAIGERAFLLSTPEGNILWDCIACLDPATTALIEALGGIKAIAISHPHYYTTMQDWAAAFDAPIHLHADDRQWVMRDSPAVRFWEGDMLELGPGVELLRLGGHFPGGTALHWADGPGVLLASDILQVAPGADRVSFMWSYPNMLPLPAAKVEDIASRIASCAFEQLYGAFQEQDVESDARRIVLSSAETYVACLSANRR